MATSGETTQPAGSSEADPVYRPKRARVDLACQRCKTRKQKCDGARPSCNPCIAYGSQCRYVVPTVPSNPSERKQYIKALEDRIADLEDRLFSGGQSDVLKDDWRPNSTGEGASIVSALRDLSIHAGGYVGASSTIALGRMLGSVIGNSSGLDLDLRPDQQWDWGPKTTTSEEVYSSPGATVSYFITPMMADKLLDSYLAFFGTNFPVANSVLLLDLHCRRDHLTDVYEISILRLVYSIGGRYLETAGEAGNYFSAQNYDIALANREEIFAYGDTRSLVYLLLLAMNCIRAPREPGAWSYVGLAMRLCIELGLHRRKRVRQANLKAEIEKRLFWACYSLDRDVSNALGRPSAISDHDIDVQLPLEVNENEADPEIFRKAMSQDPNVPPNPPSAMSLFIHLCRLKRIDSDIQQTIYRVDRTLSQPETHEAVDKLLNRLLVWKDTIPRAAHNLTGSKSRYRHNVDVYMAFYHTSMRTLLQPQLYELNPPKRYLDSCSEACVGLCASYRRLIHEMPVAFSALSLQTIFLAALTLVYCMWNCPDTKMISKIISGQHDASILLYIIAERWPGYKKYRDAFEAIKSAVVDKIAEGAHKPRQKLMGVSPDLRMRIQQFNARSGGESAMHMLEDMTGEHGDLWGGMTTDFTKSSDTMGDDLHKQNTSTPSSGLNMDFDTTEQAFVGFHELSAEWVDPHGQLLQSDSQIDWRN